MVKSRRATKRVKGDVGMNETNEERLERIIGIHQKAALACDEGDPRMEVGDLLNELFNEGHTDFLVEQAERVPELESICGSLKSEWRDGVLENKRLREEIQSYQMKYENSGSIFNRQNQFSRIEELKKENERLCEKNARLVGDYKELVIQENAMQAHYSLAFKNMQMYKECCDDITLTMNTERPAEEKAVDVRRILEGVK